MAKRRVTERKTRTVSLGEVVVCDFNQGIQTIETGNVQSCIALAMHNPNRNIAVLGHFDAPSNVENVMAELAEKLEEIGDVRNFSARLVGGIVSTGFTAKFVNTNSVSDPIINQLNALGIQPEYEHYGTSVNDETNFCVSVDAMNGIRVVDDRNLGLTTQIIGRLDRSQQIALQQRMGENPRATNLGYRLDVYGGNGKETTEVKMSSRDYYQWKGNQEEPSICPSCTLI